MSRRRTSFTPNVRGASGCSGFESAHRGHSASGGTAGPDEQLIHTGSAGYYRHLTRVYSGNGNHTLGHNTP